MIKINNILVATDLSSVSTEAIDYGRDLARTFHATLHFLHVLDTTIPWGGIGGVSFDVDEAHNRIDAEARRRLRALAEATPDLPIVTSVGASTAPAVAIAEYAASEMIDLIVLGTHGRGAIGHLLIGSVAERVMRLAPCPVLTVRATAREFAAWRPQEVAAGATS